MSGDHIVPRTCTEMESEDSCGKCSLPLSDFRDEPAYVLLGDPGAGKTTALKAECVALGDVAIFLTARDFITFDPDRHPEWENRTLFIDGLDEVRTGQDDLRTPFNEIRSRLDVLGRPRFRLTCRAADWLGQNDTANLSPLAPEGKVKVLHLDPLTGDEITQILRRRLTGTDAETFITDADRRELGVLLPNPQTLDMLIRLANRGETWPESRTETFYRFCSLLAGEHNVEHRLGSPDVSVEDLLDAAGRLSAVQTLAGAPGYVPWYAEPDDGYLKAEQAGIKDRELTQHVLSTRLFTAAAESRFIPAHRHIAEYIGARHLAALIAGGLPARRVISLMTGGDGIVVTELRGLSAWLAAVCRDARPVLIDGDPVGVCLYGDIYDFSLAEKRGLLESLSERAASLITILPPDAAKSLTSPDMVPAIRGALTETEGIDERHETIIFLLSILSRGRPLPEFSDLLFNMVLDGRRGTTVQRYALGAFVHNSEDYADRVSKLKGLLGAIRSGNIQDPDRGLLGAVLTELYPDELSASDVWDYLPEGGEDVSDYQYLRFWNHLTDDLTREQAEALVDGLTARVWDVLPVLERRNLRNVPLAVLDHALQMSGDSIDSETLYRWLAIAQRARWSVSETNPSLNSIRNWLEQRPDVQKELILLGLGGSSGPGEIRRCVVELKERLCNAERPLDSGLWCLDQAVSVVGSRPWVAEHLLEEAYRSLRDRDGPEGLTLELISDRVAVNNVLRSKLGRLLEPPPPELSEMEQQLEQVKAELERRETEELAYFRSNRAALCENRAAPALLYQLAEAYFGRHIGTGDATGRKGVANLLRGEQDLVQAALHGIRGTIDRPDIPEVGEILELRQQDKMHYLCLPYLAGMAEQDVHVSESISCQELHRFRTGLMFFLCGFMDDHIPEWYGELLSARPDMVADAQLQYTLAELKRGRDHIDRLYQLAHDPGYASIAERISLPLLRAFPTRCRAGQLDSLNYLLWAAIQHADRKSLQKLIERKTALRSMNPAQMAQWIMAGLVTSSENYRCRVREFGANSDTHRRHLVDFFDEVGTYFREDLLNFLDTPAASVVVGIAGSIAGPEFLPATGRVTPARKAALLTHKLIGRTAASPAAKSGETLDSLVADASLSRWQFVLASARDSQLVASRDALYIHPTPERVVSTLNSGIPSSAGDLAALLMDVLDNLACGIRNGNTDDWRQYWNEDPQGRPTTPKHEDHCRDALLSDLRGELSKGVDAQPEGQYANDKRSDIRVSFGSEFSVPIEVKKNGHRNLWTAMHDQLIRQYASDPDAGGYGIYLVFWFGPEFTSPPPQGGRPDSPAELKKRLEETLTDEQSRKIAVCVIDVSG